MLAETRHSDFIHRPITIELEKVLVVCAGLSDGLASYAVGDYMMQSLLLRMTGFLEQKLRCMCWDFATWNLKYRRRLLKDEDNLGEYSSLKQKNSIYHHIRTYLLDQTKYPHLSDSVLLREEKKTVIDNTKNLVKNSLSKSVMKYWNERKFNEFVKSKSIYNPEYFFTDTTLNGLAVKYFDALIDYRNQWAHNTTSQLEHTPVLSELNPEYEKYKNPYIWITLMIIMDQFYIMLYDKYRLIVDGRSY